MCLGFGQAQYAEHPGPTFMPRLPQQPSHLDVDGSVCVNVLRWSPDMVLPDTMPITRIGDLGAIGVMNSQMVSVVCQKFGLQVAVHFTGKQPLA